MSLYLPMNLESLLWASFSKIFENIESVVMGLKLLTSFWEPDLWMGITLPILSLFGKVPYLMLSLKSSDRIGEIICAIF